MLNQVNKAADISLAIYIVLLFYVFLACQLCESIPPCLCMACRYFKLCQLVHGARKQHVLQSNKTQQFNKHKQSIISVTFHTGCSYWKPWNMSFIVQFLCLVHILGIQVPCSMVLYLLSVCITDVLWVYKEMCLIEYH